MRLGSISLALIHTALGMGMALSIAASGAASSAAPQDSNAVVVSDTNDVMDGASPKIPTFPKLAPKPGYLRGYVKDSQGRPLEGAKVMARSSVVGGFASSVTAETDGKGYYEIEVPFGTASVWCAGYAVTYNGVRIANSLRPADGKLSHFSTKDGSVENFVWIPYGIANEATASEKPYYCGAYFGAAFTIGYTLKDETFPLPGSIPVGSTIEVTLTPQGPLIDGSTGKALLIRKKLEMGSFFEVNNVPIGRYTIAVKLIQGGKTESLQLKENSYKQSKGGLTPKETTESATVIFRSEHADPGIIRVTGGNMERLSLLVKRLDSAE